jgi:hypothetical protein
MVCESNRGPRTRWMRPSSQSLLKSCAATLLFRQQSAQLRRTDMLTTLCSMQRRSPPTATPAASLRLATLTGPRASAPRVTCVYESATPTWGLCTPCSSGHCKTRQCGLGLVCTQLSPASRHSLCQPESRRHRPRRCARARACTTRTASAPRSRSWPSGAARLVRASCALAGLLQLPGVRVARACAWQGSAPEGWSLHDGTFRRGAALQGDWKDRQHRYTL